MTGFADAARWVASAFDVTSASAMPPPPPPAPPPPPPVGAAPVLAGIWANLPDAMEAVAPGLSDDALAAWVGVLIPPMKSSGFTTPNRVAAALGQMAVESAGFKALSENLNYSADGLRATFPTHFNGDADDYARQPERIANRVYANRYGNGDEASGDGWKYRGGGLIGTTFRDNYTTLARAMKMDVDTCVAWVRTPAGAAVSACYYLAGHGLIRLADAWAITDLSRAVNGGSNGLSERIRLSNLARDAMNEAQ